MSRIMPAGQYCRLRFFRFIYLAVSAYLLFALAVLLCFFSPSFSLLRCPLWGSLVFFFYQLGEQDTVYVHL